MIEPWRNGEIDTRSRLHLACREIERLQIELKRLQHRIHNQRVMLRDNWETIERRASHKRAWYPSKLLTALLHRSGKSVVSPVESENV